MTGSRACTEHTAQRVAQQRQEGRQGERETRTQDRVTAEDCKSSGENRGEGRRRGKKHHNDSARLHDHTSKSGAVSRCMWCTDVDVDGSRSQAESQTHQRQFRSRVAGLCLPQAHCLPDTHCIQQQVSAAATVPVYA